MVLRNDFGNGATSRSAVGPTAAICRQCGITMATREACRPCRKGGLSRASQAARSLLPSHALA